MSDRADGAAVSNEGRRPPHWRSYSGEGFIPRSCSAGPGVGYEVPDGWMTVVDIRQVTDPTVPDERVLWEIIPGHDDLSVGPGGGYGLSEILRGCHGPQCPPVLGYGAGLTTAAALRVLGIPTRLSFLAETLRRMGISPESPFCGISGPQARFEGAEWVLKPRNGPFQGRHGGPADRSGPRFPRRGAMPPFPRRPRASIPTLSSRRSHAAGPAPGSGAGRDLHSHARRPRFRRLPAPGFSKKVPIYTGDLIRYLVLAG